MNTCKNCKYWSRRTYHEQREKSTGKMFMVITVDGKPRYDSVAYDLILCEDEFGDCSETARLGQVDPGTSYGDGIAFHEDFGCIHHEPK